MLVFLPFPGDGGGFYLLSLENPMKRAAMMLMAQEMVKIQ